MFPSVRQRFRGFNLPFEGTIPFMYPDRLGGVAVGVGCRLGSLADAQALPFYFKVTNKAEVGPGTLATPDQIASEWERVARTPRGDLPTDRALYEAFDPLTDLELSFTVLNELFGDQTLQGEIALKRLPWTTDFDDWPADAQLGLMSMAWVLGADGFAARGYQDFTEACEQQDFAAAAAFCRLTIPGLDRRNLVHAVLFQNAALVVEFNRYPVRSGAWRQRYEPSILYFPSRLSASA